MKEQKYLPLVEGNNIQYVFLAGTMLKYLLLSKIKINEK